MEPYLGGPVRLRGCCQPSQTESQPFPGAFPTVSVTVSLLPLSPVSLAPPQQLAPLTGAPRGSWSLHFWSPRGSETLPTQRTLRPPAGYLRAPGLQAQTRESRPDVAKRAVQAWR